MCVGYFLVLLDVTIVNVTLPQIGKGLGASMSGLQWIVDGYALALAALLLASGTIGDLYGHRRVVLAGLAVFGLASLACGLAPTTGVLIGSCVVQGIAAALLLPGTLAIISQTFPEPGAGPRHWHLGRRRERRASCRPAAGRAAGPGTGLAIGVRRERTDRADRRVGCGAGRAPRPRHRSWPLGHRRHHPWRADLVIWDLRRYPLGPLRCQHHNRHCRLDRVPRPCGLSAGGKHQDGPDAAAGALPQASVQHSVTKHFVAGLHTAGLITAGLFVAAAVATAILIPSRQRVRSPDLPPR